MINIIGLKPIVRNSILVTVTLTIGIHYIVKSYLDPGVSVFKLISISSSVSAIISYVLISGYSSRKIWSIARYWDRSLYPDLNGTWEGVIVTNESDRITVKAVIRQSLVSTEIDIHGKTVKSITLSAEPCIEKGQHILYYVYRANPRNLEWPSYLGATTFYVRKIVENGNECLSLSGSYFTSRKMAGSINLKQMGQDPNVDVSFY